jgi:imidazolonepropionase-like amidohydrolase
MTVVPGLINMHEHLSVVHPGTHEEQEFANETGPECLQRMTRNAEGALRVGVTTLRLAGEKDGLDIELRASIAARQVAGPRIWTAAQPLDYFGGGRSFVGAIECLTVDDYRRVAKEQIERGADYLKVMLSGGVAGDGADTVGLSIEQFEAVRLVARESRVRIAVHTAATPHPIMDRLVDDGVDSLEHCYLMDAALLQRCVSRGILLVLTPLVSRSPEYLEEIGVAPRTIEQMEQAGEAHWRIVRSAVEANARIALGTDLHSHVVLHGATAPVRELELYEEAGAAPEMLLSIASRNGASWLGVGERLGLVEEGFEADLLVLEANPFRSGAAAFRALRHVISRGALVES